jgi:hypothetical protein
MSLTGNKGEWSEIYVLLRLLSTGKLYAADGKLNKNKSIFYDILRIFREEDVGKIIFKFKKTDMTIRLLDENESKILVTKNANEFEEEANYLLEQIKSNTSTGSFSILRTESFMSNLYCDKLKAKSTDKSDIHIQIHDSNIGIKQILGFSVKSRLGNDSTLLNAGKTTNVTFKLTGQVTDEIANEINDFMATKRPNGKSQEMIEIFKFFHKYNIGYEFVDIDEPVFKNNLMLIDSNLPKIYGFLLVEYYEFRNKHLRTALEELKQKNPLGYDLSQGHPFYEYTFKKFITETSLGLVPKTVWDGMANATGGYIIVREDGEVLCYHLYNRNEFEEYLLNNTYFDTPSRTRHGFGKVYHDNNGFFIKLNFQIRFK